MRRQQNGGTPQFTLSGTEGRSSSHPREPESLTTRGRRSYHRPWSNTRNQNDHTSEPGPSRPRPSSAESQRWSSLSQRRSRELPMVPGTIKMVPYMNNALTSLFLPPENTPPSHTTVHVPSPTPITPSLSASSSDVNVRGEHPIPGSPPALRQMHIKDERSPSPITPSSHITSEAPVFHTDSPSETFKGKIQRIGESGLANGIKRERSPSPVPILLAVSSGTVRFAPLPPDCQKDATPNWRERRRHWAELQGNTWKARYPHLKIIKSFLRYVSSC
jgi:hypothetical protein